MLPLHDDIPSRTTPVVNYAIIALTALVFLAQLGESGDGPSLIERYGMIPARVSDPDAEVRIVRGIEQVRLPNGDVVQRPVEAPAAPAGVPAWATMFTCILLHGGWMHFLGNMWFLWIFGDNVEDRFGHLGYLLLYLGFGFAASLAHYATAPESAVPTIGASGAIAGVMGAYLWLYPGARVMTVIPIGVLYVTVLPAPVFLGFWFVIQSLQGITSITSTASTGVAWWAHIGGFVAGFVVALLLGRGNRLRPPVEFRRTNYTRGVFPRSR